MATDMQRRMLTLCAIRHEHRSVSWELIARIAQRDRGLDLLYRAELPENSSVARDSLPVLQSGLTDLTDAAQRVEDELLAAQRVGAHLVTVLDDDYPANLRLIPNLPPFLFVLGALRPDDALSVAVVGTRQASDDGLARAASLARQLVERRVTVTSGLARGIDAAAHKAALDNGGRTVAVIGTGITRCYPPEHAGLSEEIAQRGAVVSQFWPTASAAQFTFPRRNVVMSGIAQGTVVIEASRTSGAKMQARLAAEHGKQVFLLRSLVATQEWAQRMIKRETATVVDQVEDVVDRLAPSDRVLRAGDQRSQLALDLL